MNNSFREWFVFTRRERTGIIVLVTLIIFFNCLPWFFADVFEKSDTALTIEVQEALAQLQKNRDSPAHTRSFTHEKPATRLFEFDPNTLSPEGWRRLGLRDRAIQIIQNYLSHGGKFRQPSDLEKIYGLPKELAAQLLPYVRIKSPKTFSVDNDRSSGKQEEPPRFKKRAPTIVDINVADTLALIALPGIGNKLAHRIINFREKLGGFYSVEQVRETYGLSDSTFQKIRSLLKVSGEYCKKININTADYKTLSQHPYRKKYRKCDYKVPGTAWQL